MDNYVNGKTPRREKLLNQSGDHIPQSNYNDVIAELINDQQSRDNERIEAIRLIPDYRRRLIMAAVLANIPQQHIAKICNISQAAISLIYHGHR